MQAPAWLKRIKETWSWGRFAWQVAVAFGLTGVIGSIAGSAWAVIVGVPLPIAIMVGYCTLVGAVYLAMAPLAFRVLASSSATKVEKTSLKPNYVAVRLMHQYTLGEASRLWCDLDQNGKSTKESESWSQALGAAIQRGDLPFERQRPWDSEEGKNPRWDTIISRKTLQEYAAKIGQSPAFLKDA